MATLKVTESALAGAVRSLRLGAPTDANTTKIIGRSMQARAMQALDVYRRTPDGRTGEATGTQVTSDEYAVRAGYVTDPTDEQQVKAGRVKVSRMRSTGRILALCGEHADECVSLVLAAINATSASTLQSAIARHLGEADATPDAVADAVRAVAPTLNRERSARAARPAEPVEPVESVASEPVASEPVAPVRSTYGTELASVAASLARLTPNRKTAHAHAESAASVLAHAARIASLAGILSDDLAGQIERLTLAAVEAE